VLVAGLVEVASERGVDFLALSSDGSGGSRIAMAPRRIQAAVSMSAVGESWV
jgi:hypothetical protein